MTEALTQTEAGPGRRLPVSLSLVGCLPPGRRVTNLKLEDQDGIQVIAALISVPVTT